MTTSTLDVGDLFSVLGAQGIEKQLLRIAGVGSVSVNPVSGSATVAYDQAKTSVAKIKAAIKQCGYHCAGEAMPWRFTNMRTDSPDRFMNVCGKAKATRIPPIRVSPEMARSLPNFNFAPHRAARTSTTSAPTL